MFHLANRDVFSRFRASFTLIELLVVMALIAILSVVVIITLNPAELLKQSRDSTRVSDLSNLNIALSAYNADQSSGFMGTSTIVYVSIPDSSSICANLGLPILPSGYTYSCSTSDNYRKTDSTGWIPVNFNQASFGTPLSSLPIDPINTTSTGEYYTYVPGGSWEITGSLESSMYRIGGSKDSASNDGGDNPGQIEVGTDLDLMPIEYDPNLTMYWPLNEGSAASTTDRAGKSPNFGNLINSPTWETSGCKRGSCLTFNGSNSYVNMNIPSSFAKGSIGAFTIAIWFKTTTTSNWRGMVSLKGFPGSKLWVGLNTGNPAGTLGVSAGTNTNSGGTAIVGSGKNDGLWHHFALVSNGGISYSIYIDGALANSVDIIDNGGFSFNSGTPSAYGGDYFGWGSYGYFAGTLDEVRTYNRSFSGSEILALYNATK